ncbi:hypothetical protein AcW2_006460 [Taiwanofungus camphoratus]|nr:hypothetical protein AcW2_006460 [Antrodia cinnamomea]
MSITTLPVELLDAICEPLATDPSTLSSLALTSTAVNPSVTRLLYRTLSVSTHARNLPVVGTLAARPALARLVHTFSITLDEAETALHPLYKQLQTALRRMPQLASLELLVDTHASWMLPGVDCDLEYRCLEHFACSFPLDAHLSAFLGRLPSLRSLQLSAPAPPNTSLLPSSYIPLLESYTGPGSLLPLLSPRPLTTLHLSGDLTAVDIPGTSGALPVGEPPPDFYETANWLASPDGETKDNKDAVAQVQVLSAITSAPPAQLLEALARAYPKLVCLRLMTTCAFWEAPDMTLYARISAALASLPALASFELSGMHWEARPKSSPFVGVHGCIEKEWVSPPVTPRVAEFRVELEDRNDRDFELGEAFMEWSY